MNQILYTIPSNGYKYTKTKNKNKTIPNDMEKQTKTRETKKQRKPENIHLRNICKKTTNKQKQNNINQYK